MKYTLKKMKKRFTAMIVCVIIGGMSCLLAGSHHKECGHPCMRSVSDEREMTVSETCGCCACASCEAQNTYLVHEMYNECPDCGYRVKISTAAEQISHVCLCTICECCCDW